MKIVKYLSFTASRDRFYHYYFIYAGLKSVTTGFTDGTTMHCWVPKNYDQSKPNLLLLHGFGANAMWQYGELLRHFIPQFNVYVPDLLFFGGSYTKLHERTETFQATCMKRLMDMHGVDKLSLVGTSYGGFVGYRMAVQFPKMVEKLVLCCTGVCLEENDMKSGLFKVSDLEEAASILVPQTPDKLRELTQFSFVKPPPVKGVPSYFLHDFINVMCTTFVQEKKELIYAILKDRHFSELPRITQKTLIIWGDQDQIFPIELGHRLQRHIGESARLVIIENAGHAVNLEKSKDFIKHLKEFLDEDVTAAQKLGVN
ncbi:hypothetical protein DCAR_0831085 [Daucus carota subsp. sativus]|uniref:AB hydrolase-1 domain-containing protein n=2 Tax=Daucus carota subsp. sativus TaxID=79200 RepID=A0AAF0XNX7_DAUCS|nr:hypothetical protein DCAR_0831085 [Daucus carota subsp. sativus]